MILDSIRNFCDVLFSLLAGKSYTKGAFHCPCSKGQLSLTWQSWLMAIMMVMMGDALQTRNHRIGPNYDDDDAFLSNLS